MLWSIYHLFLLNAKVNSIKACPYFQFAEQPEDVDPVKLSTEFKLMHTFIVRPG